MTTTDDDDTVATVLPWLATDRDVLLRGERGSGKSTTLEALRRDLSGRRVPGVLLRASGPAPFAAVLDHPSAPTRVADESGLVAWLSDEVAERRSVLMLDDVDRLDPGSLRVVQRALVRTSVRLVGTTTTDLLRAPATGSRELLVARAPAEVRIPPLGLAALDALTSDVLDGPADATLTGTLLAQSGGNPGVAVALLAAARAQGAIRRRDGRYVDDGRLLDVPADAVAALLLGNHDPALVRALERLAVLGPVTLDVATHLVGPDALDDLADAGRLVELDVAGTGSLLVVAPPALARALRDRVAPAHRRRLVAATREHAGDAVTAVEQPPEDLAGLLSRDTTGGTEFLRWSSQVAGVVHERAAQEEASARAAWARDQRLATANDYLTVLMRRPARDRIAAVFRETHRTPEDTEADVVAFRYLRRRWESWHDGDAPEPGSPSGTDGAVDAVSRLEDLKEQLVTAMRDGTPPEDVAGAPPADVDAPVFHGGPEVLRAAALLEAGRPDLALAVLDRAGEDDAGPEVRHYRVALRVQALTHLDRLDEAERLARRHLGAAYDTHDAFAVRVHATTLAEVLTFAGEVDSGWQVLSTALRLGPAGPIETTFYRRGLALGSVLQVRAGHVDLARAVLGELERAPRVYRPLVRSLRVVGAVAVAVATGDRTTAGEIAWRAGLSYAEAGYRQPALITWAFGPPVLTPERAAALRATREGVVLPMLDPYLDLQLALADRNEDAVAATLPGVLPQVARTLTTTAREVLGLDTPAAPVRAATPTEALSDREREVAALAREGHGNREIADRLHLSVRTVENHMSRALRKLGLQGRTDLRRWSGT
ncbi:helix-turn-helix transcriptional regulator [Cellulomonas triticagri]|uniref:helix-turn-helix transcriptional regulator n=1 Tax=Cellulomonas triticagri TaxID=2483352 RepID=UPI0011C349A5|nr:LuxR C-terminal-related transcriptional regulator [Cellulomonas triticagri]